MRTRHIAAYMSHSPLSHMTTSNEPPMTAPISIGVWFTTSYHDLDIHTTGIRSTLRIWHTGIYSPQEKIWFLHPPSSISMGTEPLFRWLRFSIGILITYRASLIPSVRKTMSLVNEAPSGWRCFPTMTKRTNLLIHAIHSIWCSNKSIPQTMFYYCLDRVARHVLSISLLSLLKRSFTSVNTRYWPKWLHDKMPMLPPPWHPYNICTATSKASHLPATVPSPSTTKSDVSPAVST